MQDFKYTKRNLGLLANYYLNLFGKAGNNASLEQCISSTDDEVRNLALQWESIYTQIIQYGGDFKKYYRLRLFHVLIYLKAVNELSNEREAIIV